MSIRNNDQEVIQVAHEWLLENHSVYLITVVRTWGSSPRPVGSLAAVRDDGELVGSVSGGCVEKQLVESLSPESVAERRISTIHINDEQARRFGLACGGELELVFELFNDCLELEALANATRQRNSLRRTVNLNTGEVLVAPLTAQGESGKGDVKDTAFYYDGNTVSKVFGPSWRVLIIGAGQLSRYTAEFALALDYEVLVCDPRPGFKEAWRVPDVPVLPMSPDDAVLQYATDANSAVLALTHDPNADDLALLEALPSDAFYVGALGSTRNNEKRCQRLADLGLEQHHINRLVGPIGIDINSRTSAEIAVSIVAQLIQVRNNKS